MSTITTEEWLKELGVNNDDEGWLSTEEVSSKIGLKCRATLERLKEASRKGLIEHKVSSRPNMLGVNHNVVVWRVSLGKRSNLRKQRVSAKK